MSGAPFSKEQQTGRVWQCPKNNVACSRKVPCRSCLGRRNRRGGLKKQRIARRALGVPDARYAGQNGNEENWRGAWRVEVKSGAQVRGLASRFLGAEAQSEASRATGDVRPFMLVAMPADWGSEGLVVVRLSEWQGQQGGDSD